MSAFETDDGGGVFVLVIDTAEFMLERPVSIYPAAVSSVPVPTGPTPIVRLRMRYTEAEELWKVLDETIGSHYRERMAVAKDMQAYKERWGDYRVPTQAEYDEAIRHLADLRVPQDDPVFVHAAETINRFEQATRG